MHKSHRSAVVVRQCVSCVEAVQCVQYDRDDETRRARITASLQERRERTPLHVFHHHIMHSVLGPQVHDGHDIGMVEACSDSRLIEQHRDKRFFLSQVRMQHLDGIEPLKSGFSCVSTQVDIGHPTMAQSAQQFVPAQGV